ncbi:MAG: DNA polymerase III subunit delta' [Chloroflexi bacterium]|nr:DNA polymerase III subunit delta' [Chloroflexota bacterium]
MEWPVVGHEWAVKLLQQALATGQLSHAYLLSGPPQVGKTTLARACAQALLCTGEEPPCGQCLACRKVQRTIHPDLFIVAPQTNNLLIDQVRELQRQAALSPVEARHKVFILRQMEQATTPAANALLKTLEEPPAPVVLFLTLTGGEQTLPTVASRCQQITLRPLPTAQVAQALEEKWQVPPERAELLARLAQGRLGWAVTMSNDEKAWQQRAQRLDDLLTLSGQSRVERMRYAERLSRKDADAASVLRLWSSWWRDVLLLQHGCEDQVANIDHLEVLRREARRHDDQQARAFLGALATTGRYLEQNVNAQLALESLLLRLPRPVRQA